MAVKRFNGIPHPLIYAALIPVHWDLGLPAFDLLMPQKQFTVGRGEHNDICIRGAQISDEHCKLVWDSEKKAMFVEWMPTTNGTWIRNTRHECHQLKKEEAFPLLGEVSFAPTVKRYGKPTGPNDYLYTFRLYAEHELEEQLEPEELAERKKARARFKTARFDEASATRKCVVPYRSSTDRAPHVSLPRQPTPPFIPPPPLGKDFRTIGNVGTYEDRDDPDGHDWADPDIVWRGDVPVNPDTEPILPGEIELWSHHFGLPVGLHSEYSTYSGTPYNDTFTEIDRQRQERCERFIKYLRSAEYKADTKAFFERAGQTYISPTPSPSPAPSSDSGQSPHIDEIESAADPPTARLLPIAASSSRVRTPVHSQPSPNHLHKPDEPSSSLRRDSSMATHTDGGMDTTIRPEASTRVGLRKRKRDDNAICDESPAKRRLPRATFSGPGTRTRSTRAQSEKTALRSAAKPRRPKPVEPGPAHSTTPRRSARLVGKPAVRYKY